MNTHFHPGPSQTLHLPATGSWPAAAHEFDDRSVWAIRTALAARRPLLIRGEPGVGKSQLARAAAVVLQVPFLSHVVHARCEANDLLYHYDAVARLAQAQVVGTVRAGSGSDPAGGDWVASLEPAKFVRPGILWWAFDWASGQAQSERYLGGKAEVETHERPAGWQPKDGCVVLIDEIDKADADVPNGLLESLGNTGFLVPEAHCAVALPEGTRPPLVVITTNEERELPAAFLRRCLVLQMALPTGGEKEFLLRRARVHYPKASQISDAVLMEAANQLLGERQGVPGPGAVRPGAAEYLDLLRALVELYPGNEKEQLRSLGEIQEFALRKNPTELR